MSTSHKKVLMLSPYFVPRRRVGSLRTFKFARHLKSFGWDPHIICLDVQGQKLTRFEKKVLDDTPVYRLKVPFDRTTAQSKSDISKAGQSENTGSGIFQGFLNWIDSGIPVDSWYPLLKFYQYKMETLIRQVKPDVLWSTADPWSNLLIAKSLKDKFDIPWVADLRDPWSLCPVRYKTKAGHVHKIESALESRVMAEADSIVFTARDTADLYKRQYPEKVHKMQVIHNAFDDGAEDADQTPEAVKTNREKVKMLFFGKFRSSSPVYVLINILGKLAKSHPGQLKKLEILHLGSLPEEDRQLAKEKGVEQLFKSINPVPYEYSSEVLKHADILLSILNPVRDMVIPSKFWDYLPAGVPIFSLASNSEMKEILEKTGTGIQFDFEEVDHAVEYLVSAIDHITDEKALPHFDPDTLEIEQYKAASATSKLAGLFDNLTNGVE